MTANLSASVLARLLNLAKQRGADYSLLLNRFALERLLCHDSTLANAMSQCALFGLQPTDATDEIAKVIAVVGRWLKHFKTCGVTRADIDSRAQRIDGDELRAQRRDFRAADYRAPENKRARNPFR